MEGGELCCGVTGFSPALVEGAGAAVLACGVTAACVAVEGLGTELLACDGA
jgi:hypothetical protein